MAIQLAPVTTMTYSSRKSIKSSTLILKATISEKSRIESLPIEILSRIFTHVTLPIFPESTGIEMPREYILHSSLGCVRDRRTDNVLENSNTVVPEQNLSLYSSLLVSRDFFAAALPIIYRAPDLSTDVRFQKWQRVIHQRVELGRFVRRLDLSSITPSKSSEDEEKSILDCRAVTRLLRRTPLLREVCVGNPKTETTLDRDLWDCIFSELAHLESVSLQNCQLMTEHGTALIVSTKTPRWSEIQHLRITGQDFTGLDDFETLLARQRRLRSLDLSNFTFSPTALMAIPSVARLEHLNLDNAITNLSPGEVKQLIHFLTTHESITKSLTSLTLTTPSTESTSTSTSSPPLLTEEDMTRLLTHLPHDKIRALNLTNTPLNNTHLPLLHALTNLSSLHIGAAFPIQAAESLVLGKSHTFPAASRDSLLTIANEDHSTYETVKDSHITPLCRAMFTTKLKMRLNSLQPSPPPSAGSSSSVITSISPNQEGEQPSRLRYLNLTSLRLVEAVKLIDSVLWAAESHPLEVVEVSPEVLEWKDGLMREVLGSVGWKVRSVGRRSWIERR